MRPGTHWQAAQDQPTVTLLLRHGQTPMSVQKRYAGRSDPPLTDIGVQQAAAAAKRLASAGFGVIVTSPLLRTVQTAQQVAAVTGAAVGIGTARFGKQFDRDQTIQARVAGLVDPAHAAFADFFEQGEMPQFAAVHIRSILLVHQIPHHPSHHPPPNHP